MHVVGVRVEFRSVGRADQTLPEAHGRQAVPVRGVRTVFRPVRPPGAAQETTSAEKRGGGGVGAASASPAGPRPGEGGHCGPSAETPTAAATHDVERQWRWRRGWRAKNRRLHVRRHGVGHDVGGGRTVGQATGTRVKEHVKRVEE